MKKRYTKLLEIISDGDIHSGEKLASHLDVSRAAIWKSIRYLKTLGLEIKAIRGKGYYLDKKFEFLSSRHIRRMMSEESKKPCRDIDIVFQIKSTNLHLLNRLSHNSIHGSVVFAEYQSEGRGRRNKKWVSPIGSGICFSIGWHLEVMPISLELLSLYMGIAVARSLDSIGIDKVGLKWPNDIIAGEHKIGGILLDIKGESTGPLDIVIGIGINYKLPKYLKLNIDQPITDICSTTRKNISRNMISAILLSNIFEILSDLKVGKNLDLINEWRKYDCYIGREAALILPNQKIIGLLKGIDDQGSLLMQVDGELSSYRSGEVSLRVQ
tara:strand:+ start:1875 stop:2852 length:978 start_codon:yes stop_codon:yes gene_type:complete